jgi:hypothetical protein
LEDFDVLVADRVRRTVKLLAAVASGRPVVSLEYIQRSEKEAKLLDPWDFLVTDREAEEKFQFRLSDSIRAAQKHRIFDQMKFYLDANVKPARSDMAAIIKAAGGTVVSKRSSETVVVADAKDQVEGSHSNEFVFSG